VAWSRYVERGASLARGCVHLSSLLAANYIGYSTLPKTTIPVQDALEREVTRAEQDLAG
jgi:hypothetical protein